MKHGKRNFVQIGFVIATTVFVLGLVSGPAIAQDEIDMRDLLDAVLGIDETTVTLQAEEVFAEPDPDPTPNTVSITPAGPTNLVLSNDLVLDANVGGTDTTAAWVSGTPAVVGIGITPGLTTTVTGLTVGSSVITATGDVTAATSDTTINVILATVTVTPSTDSILPLATSALGAASDDVLDVSFAWGSSDLAVATVDTAGLVTGVAPGIATITATGVNSGETDTAVITVTMTPSSSSGCFIASAAYGTPLTAEIDVLRDARDSYLLNHPFGAAFVDAYYRFSPPIADKVAQNSVFAAAVRTVLWPVIWLTGIFVGYPGFVLSFVLLTGIALTVRRAARVTS